MQTSSFGGLTPDQLLDLPLPRTVAHRLGSSNGVILGPDVVWFDHIQRVDGLRRLLQVLPELLDAYETHCGSDEANRLRRLNLPSGISHCEECSLAAVLAPEVEWLEHLQQIDNLQALLDALPAVLDELQARSGEFGTAEESGREMAVA